MTERSLQVTYRKGKPFSAYLHLPHQTGEKSAKTVASADGLLVVDYGQNERREVAAVGADERLAAPFSPLQLQVKLRRLLGAEVIGG